MKIEELDIDEGAIELYREMGIQELYPPQAEAVDAGLLNGKNIVAAIPTASGKTLLAELAMLKAIKKEGKALYIVPLRALASEKYEQFLKMSPLGVKTGISTGDFESRDERLGSNDIIVATSEKVDSLLRNGVRWLEDITCIVVDEVHLLDSAHRGPTLEVVITKLRKLNSEAQIIALSATVGNAHEIAKWLSANLILSEWRPTKLNEGVFWGDAIYFPGGQKEIERLHSDDAVTLVLDTIKEGGQSLVFESSRRNCSSFAKKASFEVAKQLDKRQREELKAIALNVRETGETENAELLAKCIEGGVAFHHAGLNSAHRKIVEDAFRANRILMIASTPTLAAGLNLPARRVIIRSYKRYDTNMGMQPIPVLEYKQMAGRAGRPHLDPYGESILIAKSFDEMESVFENFIYASPEDIWSKLGTENALRTHVLSTLASGFANSFSGLLEFLSSTFFAYQQREFGLESVVMECLDFLEAKDMLIERENHIVANQLGKLVSMLYIDPLSAARIIDGMKKADNLTDIGLLQLVCSAPDMRLLYMRSRDYEMINDYVISHHESFIEVPDPFKATEYEWFLSEVKTAMMLQKWVEEMSLDDITKRFQIGEGDVHAITELAEWLMHSTSRLSHHLEIGSNAPDIMEKRIHYGAGAELMELVKVSGVGRVRARKLFKNGFKTTEQLRAADPRALEKLVGTKTARNILKALGVNIETDSNDYLDNVTSNNQGKQKTFGDFN
ncbi:helicase [Methanohalophilus levihalophilus]|uniref:ATP-dependent DNA helicase n=1 Tax=Methanohalophilus levihalophilus TaxID=1431282 RepID=UPI001AE8E778|nr:ATP-dependent DNA helicase [Methanohalophilus levihalophilus]MBP2030510.1 helicase [Methanohalophilus levihalophilus]